MPSGRNRAMEEDEDPPMPTTEPIRNAGGLQRDKIKLGNQFLRKLFSSNKGTNDLVQVPVDSVQDPLHDLDIKVSPVVYPLQYARKDFLPRHERYNVAPDNGQWIMGSLSPAKKRGRPRSSSNPNFIPITTSSSQSSNNYPNIHGRPNLTYFGHVKGCSHLDKHMPKKVPSFIFPPIDDPEIDDMDRSQSIQGKASFASFVAINPENAVEWDMYMTCYGKGEYNMSQPPDPPKSLGFVYMPAPPPWKEATRQEAWNAYKPRLKNYNPSHIIRSVSEEFGSVEVVVSFFEDRYEIPFLESGMIEKRVPRARSFAAHCLYSTNTVLVKDTKEDWRFKTHPYVHARPHLRFFAGAPMYTTDNVVIGVLSILAVEPRLSFNRNDIRALEHYAEDAMSLLENTEEDRSSRRIQPVVESSGSLYQSQLVNQTPPKSRSGDSSADSILSDRYRTTPLLDRDPDEERLRRLRKLHLAKKEIIDVSLCPPALQPLKSEKSTRHPSRQLAPLRIVDDNSQSAYIPGVPYTPPTSGEDGDARLLQTLPTTSQLHQAVEDIWPTPADENEDWLRKYSCSPAPPVSDTPEPILSRDIDFRRYAMSPAPRDDDPQLSSNALYHELSRKYSFSPELRGGHMQEGDDESQANRYVDNAQTQKTSDPSSYFECSPRHYSGSEITSIFQHPTNTPDIPETGEESFAEVELSSLRALQTCGNRHSDEGIYASSPPLSRIELDEAAFAIDAGSPRMHQPIPFNISPHRQQAQISSVINRSFADSPVLPKGSFESTDRVNHLHTSDSSSQLPTFSQPGPPPNAPLPPISPKKGSETPPAEQGSPSQLIRQPIQSSIPRSTSDIAAMLLRDIATKLGYDLMYIVKVNPTFGANKTDEELLAPGGLDIKVISAFGFNGKCDWNKELHLKALRVNYEFYSQQAENGLRQSGYKWGIIHAIAGSAPRKNRTSGVLVGAFKSLRRNLTNEPINEHDEVKKLVGACKELGYLFASPAKLSKQGMHFRSNTDKSMPSPDSLFSKDTSQSTIKREYSLHRDSNDLSNKSLTYPANSSIKRESSTSSRYPTHNDSTNRNSSDAIPRFRKSLSPLKKEFGAGQTYFKKPLSTPSTGRMQVEEARALRFRDDASEWTTDMDGSVEDLESIDGAADPADPAWQNESMHTPLKEIKKRHEMGFNKDFKWQ